MKDRRPESRDCHGFEKPAGKCHGLAGVGVGVEIFEPQQNPYPECRSGVSWMAKYTQYSVVER